MLINMHEVSIGRVYSAKRKGCGVHTSLPQGWVRKKLSEVLVLIVTTPNDPTPHLYGASQRKFWVWEGEDFGEMARPRATLNDQQYFVICENLD